jgi:hypothetical protein
MKALRTAAGLLSLIAISLIAAAPAMAEGEEEEPVVPSENSAVNQYTEAFPTAGGEKEARSESGRHISTGRVLGSANAKKLEKHGAAGRATANFAAHTAPRTVNSQASENGGNEHSGQAGAVAPGGGSQGGGGAGGGGSATGGGSGSAGQAAPPSTSPGPAAAAPQAHADGSSGISEVLSRATGGSGGGGMGIFLPLLIVAAIAWAIAYSVRQRRPVS